MTFPIDHSAKHIRHHEGGGDTQPAQLHEADKDLVGSCNVTLEDGTQIVIEAHAGLGSLVNVEGHTDDGVVKSVSGLNALVIVDDDAKKAHKTIDKRVDVAAAHQLDEKEGEDADYYEQWADDVGPREKDKDYAPKHRHQHGKSREGGRHGH